MDRLRTDPGEEGDDPTIIDQHISSERPIQHLGRVVIQKGPVAPVVADDERALTQGARQTIRGVHHVALMRNAELVVKYLPGPSRPLARLAVFGRVPMLAGHRPGFP